MKMFHEGQDEEQDGGRNQWSQFSFPWNKSLEE